VTALVTGAVPVHLGIRGKSYMIWSVFQ